MMMSFVLLAAGASPFLAAPPAIGAVFVGAVAQRLPMVPNPSIFNPNTLARARFTDFRSRHFKNCLVVLALPGVCLLAHEGAHSRKNTARWNRWNEFVSFIETAAKTRKGDFLCPARCRDLLKKHVREVEKRKGSLVNLLTSNWYEVVYLGWQSWVVHLPKKAPCSSKNPDDRCWFEPDTSPASHDHVEASYYDKPFLFAVKDIAIHEQNSKSSPVVATMKKCELALDPQFSADGKWENEEFAVDAKSNPDAGKVDKIPPWLRVYHFGSGKVGYVKQEYDRVYPTVVYNLLDHREWYLERCK